MKALILLLLPLAFLACRNNADTRDDDRMDNDTLVLDADGKPIVDANNDGVADNLDANNDGVPDNNVERTEENAYAEFGTTSGTRTLRLRDWRSKMDFKALGTPTDTLSRVLTLGSDTHQGSTVIEYKYNDINLEYFLPKGGNDAWLKTIEIKGGDWATARGIKVGDSVADIRNMYPKLNEMTDGKSDYQYTYQLEESVVMFGIQDDKVSRIKIEYNIP